MTRCPLCHRRAELVHVEVAGSRVRICAGCVMRGRSCGYAVEPAPDVPRREEAEAFARALEEQAAIVERQLVEVAA